MDGEAPPMVVVADAVLPVVAGGSGCFPSVVVCVCVEDEERQPPEKGTGGGTEHRQATRVK